MLVFTLKYGGRAETAVEVGRLMGEALLPTDFFEGITAVVPVPLAPGRERRRGYNQSERLARGIALATGLKLETDVVRRTVENPSQTRLRYEERRENVADIFTLHDDGPIENRHILLVDDILTTGATLLSCGRELSKARGVRISILTLALATHHFPVSDGGMVTP